ncbi:hypothetical protein AAVH_19865 [Aphelenchoides avenae]|nr:hypothetical protein AAVH_19865 [Aphelenchus avenae]
MLDAGFWWSVFLSSTLWSTVDVSGQVYRIAFGSFLSYIGEDEHHAGFYAFVGDGAAMGACFCSILVGFFIIIARYSEKTQEAYPYWKLVLCGITTFVDLLAMVILSVISNDDLRTTHWIIGSGYVVYRVCSALEYETLLELTPKLMRKKEEILHCWCLTLCFRVGVQWFVLRLIHNMLHIWNWPLWGIFAFQLLFKLAFVMIACVCLKPQPPAVEAVPIARPDTSDVAAEQGEVLAARVFDGAAVQIPGGTHNQAYPAERQMPPPPRKRAKNGNRKPNRGPDQVAGSAQYYAGRQGPVGSAPLVGIAGFPRP